MGDENTPLVASNLLLYPATPTRKKKLPSDTSSPSTTVTTSSQFSTPRRRKTAGLTRQTEVSTSSVTLKRWPRIGERIPSEDIKGCYSADIRI